MKNILTIAIACAGLMSFSACNNFLDEEPRSTLTNVAYYQTQAQAEANVNYLYRTGAMNSYTNFGSAYIASFQAVQENLTGYFTNSYEGQEIICRFSRTLTRQENTMQIASSLDNVWDNCYRGVNVANGAIKYIPTISMEQNVADRLMGESKFFRAFNYYQLVKVFGDVPFYTEPYETAENMELARTDKATIYALMESDLKDAMAVLADATFAANGHRVTKHVAAMLLSEVYMRQGKYAEAADAARVVINSAHSLTKNDDMALGSAYNKLRQYDDMDESIYAYEFNNEISNSGWLTTYAFDGSATSLFGTYAITQRIHGPIDRFLNVYESNDLRRQPNQFFHWEYTNPATGASWKSAENLACCWYYYDEEAMLNTGRGTKDWNIYRYAEVLLNAAESIAQANGVTSEAAGYLAQVQARANMDGKTADAIAADLMKLSKEKFVEACWTERLREMPLEFKMWDLCSRIQKFPNISEKTPGQVTWVNLVGAQNASGATFKESDLLWPLSVNEIQRNPNLEQNEGYSRQ